MDKVFDAERFRNYVIHCFGMNYLTRLEEITGKKRKTVYKWCNPDYAPKGGLDTQNENAISKALLKQGISINWSDFYRNIDDEEPILEDKINFSDTFDPYDALIQAKKDLSLQTNMINELQNELYKKEEENILLRKRIAQLTNS